MLGKIRKRLKKPRTFYSFLLLELNTGLITLLTKDILVFKQLLFRSPRIEPSLNSKTSVITWMCAARDRNTLEECFEDFSWRTCAWSFWAWGLKNETYKSVKKHLQEAAQSFVRPEANLQSQERLKLFQTTEK